MTTKGICNKGLNLYKTESMVQICRKRFNSPKQGLLLAEELCYDTYVGSGCDEAEYSEWERFDNKSVINKIMF
jgi:hypothetical protein